MHILVLAVGDLPYFRDSFAVLSHYFSKHNLSWSILFGNPEENYRKAHPSWLKLLCHKFSPGEEFILNWDLDLLPTPNARNITEFIDPTKLSMAVDTSVLVGYGKFNQNFKYNGGLIGIPHYLRLWAENIYETHAPGTYPSYEQYYLNDAIVNYAIHVSEIAANFNTLYPKGNESILHRQLWHAADFQHYTFGCTEEQRPKLIRKHRENYFEQTRHTS
jgi:hypothetical protein